ncbi:MAG: heparan-alpha-glucosaminide N-acetyltransferase domain-containing protein [Mycetocola sp.]
MSAPVRLGGLDLARGLALIGMLAAHTLIIDDFSWTEPGSWLGVVDGRSSILFATVAGVSMTLMSGRQSPPTGDELVRTRLRLLVRAALIYVIGSLLNVAGAPIAIILEYYALCMAFSLIVLSWSWKRLAVLAAVLAVVGPLLQRALGDLLLQAPGGGTFTDLLVLGYYPVITWFTFFAVGMALGRAGADRPVVQRSALLIGAGCAVVGYSVAAVLPAEVASPDAGLGMIGWDSIFSSAPHSGGIAEVVGSGGYALAIIALCLMLPRAVLGVAAPIRAIGALALTVYCIHILSLGVLAFMGEPTQGTAVFFWSLGLALAGAWLWRLTLGQGPVERAVATVARRAATPVPPKLKTSQDKEQ